MPDLIDFADKAKALGVLKHAFAHHPILPASAPLETSEAILALMLDTFGGTSKAWLHGLRMDNTLACVAFSVDAQFEPRGLAMLSFFFRLFRALGWRMSWEFIKAFSARPKYADRYLELLLLGTLPSFQAQKLGKTMMEFLYGFAREQGYRGVILGVAAKTPAYRFYVKEGFVVDSKVVLNTIPLCNMRRDNQVG